MTMAVLVIVLAMVWVAATASVTVPNLMLGAILGLAALWLVRDRFPPGISLKRAASVAGLARLFLYELMMSAIRVALLVLSPRMRSKLRPGIIAFPLTVKSDVEITLLANLITLTPGTLSVDVGDDRSVLYVHAISVPDRQALVADIAGGFEKKIMEVFQ